MRIDKQMIDNQNCEWRIAGYTSPRIRDCASTYRLVRMTDGARVRVYSNKLYWLDISRATLQAITDTPTGTNERACGGGAAKLETDRARVGFCAA